MMTRNTGKNIDKLKNEIEKELLSLTVDGTKKMSSKNLENESEI
jgi:hypothetical protein